MIYVLDQFFLYFFSIGFCSVKYHAHFKESTNTTEVLIDHLCPDALITIKGHMFPTTERNKGQQRGGN